MNYFIDEYQKCSTDCVYFVEKYLGITLYPCQKGMLWNFQEEDMFLVNSCRQTGKTTMLMYFMLWYALFHPGKSTAIGFNKIDTAKFCFENIINSLKQNNNMDFFYYVSSYSKSLIEFKNGSSVSFFSGSPRGYCGRTIDVFGLDEPAFIDNFEELWTTVYPVLAYNKSKILLVGTRNNQGDLFDTLYKESLIGGNLKSMNINWWDIPNRTLKWKNNMKKACGSLSFEAEFNPNRKFTI